MKSEEAIYIPTYLVFNFNDSEEIISFSNWEVLGDVRYVPPFVAGLEENSKGRVFGRKQNQREYCEFELKYLNADTRVKWERIRRMIRLGYTCLFKTEHLVTPMDGFPFEDDPTSTTGLFAKQTLQFDSAVIELPEDFAFDRIGRGIGQVPVEDVTIRVYKSSPLPVPSSPCSLITMQDFTTSQWQIDTDNDNELLEIYVEKNSGGAINTITSYGDGTLRQIVGGVEVDVDTLEWSVADSAYQPVTGPNNLNGTYVFRATIGFTLDGGEECSFTFIQYFSASINYAPTATDVAIAGKPQQGQELTLTWTYADVDGDVEDTTPTDRLVWYAFPTLSEAQTGNLTNATQLGVGSTYTIGSGIIVGKYIAARVKPYAQTGASPGTAVFSNVLGPVATNVASYTIANANSSTFNLTHTLSSADTVGIDWGDGTFQTFAANTGSTTYQKAYASGSRTITVYTTSSKVTSLSASNQGVTSVNIAALTAISSLNFSSNSGLTSITNPTTNSATWTSYNVSSCNLTGTLNISTLGSMPTDFRAAANSSLTAISFPASSAAITRFEIQNCNITGTLNLSTINVGGIVYLQNNSNMTAVTFGTTNTFNISAFYCFSTGITGTLNLSNLTNLGNVIFIYSNASMTGITFPTTSNNINSMFLYNNNLTSLDLSGLSNLGGAIRFNGNNSLTSVTFPSTTRAVTSIQAQNIGISAFDLSPLSNLSGSIDVYACESLQTITMPASNATAITAFRAYDCDLEYFDITGNTFADNIVFDISGNSMTVTEVNHMLVDADATFPSSGTGSFDISLNSTPDSSTGGFNGTGAATSLSGKGYTVTTD